MNYISINALAPVALFVYNRLDTTQQTIEHLLKNEGAKQTELYIFSDGGKDDKSWKEVRQVRNYLHNIKEEIKINKQLKDIHIIERRTNFYLEKNVTEGIKEVLEQHDRIIVLEDDICTAPTFLRFMNEALNWYEDTKKVMHISGFTNIDLPQKGDVYFTAHMMGWGWATWRDRWGYFYHYPSRTTALQRIPEEMQRRMEYNGAFPCLKNLDRNPIPWDICWELAIYAHDGLCLCPTKSLVRNIGIGNGTHFSNMKLFGHYIYDRPFTVWQPKVKNDYITLDREIETIYMPEALRDHGFRYNRFGRWVRNIYLRWFKKA